MSDVIPEPVLDQQDARVVQTILDTWLASEPGDLGTLRGILLRTVSDVRAAGVLEGHRAGWAEALDEMQAAVEGLR